MKQTLLILLAAIVLAGTILIGESDILESSSSSDEPVSETNPVPDVPESISQPEISQPVSAVVSSEPAASESSEAVSSSSEAVSEPVIPESSEPEPEPEEEKPDPTEDWRLILINADHLLPEDYTFEKTVIEGDFTFDSRAAEALMQMLADGRAAGYSLRIVSTYRTVERSDYLYSSKISEYQSLGYSAADAAVEAAKWVAPPRQSEHNAGLAIDVVSRDYDMVYGDLMHEFEDFPAFTWLSENCAEYGFVLRYPKDKQDITGITYEPWHYRYVGVEHARKMQELDMCLEEYWEYLQS